MRSRSDAGFTLLELLVVLALMGLVLAIVTPRLDLGASALRADERALVGALRLARDHAIRAERETRFTLDLANGRWAVTDAGAEGALSGRSDLTVTADAAETGRRVAAVRFMPDGTATGAEFVLTKAEARRTVRVDWLTGRVSSDAAP
jgi:general secretion pathway protein H